MKNSGNIDQLLADSFKELAQAIPIEKITIKQITDKAGVIRPTFYNHFQDKYELLEWILRTEVIDPIRPLLCHHYLDEAMEMMFTNLYNDKAFYEHAIKLEGQNSFDSIVNTCMYELVSDYIAQSSIKASTKYKWLTRERIAKYYSRSLCMFLLEWIKTGMDTVSPKQLAEIYHVLISSTMTDIQDVL